jgi:hypothetical protein
MQTRGKFHCQSEKRVYWNSDVRVYSFAAVCNDGTPENERYHRYTPSGSIEITVDNPSVSFEPGKFYFVDFIEATK